MAKSIRSKWKRKCRAVKRIRYGEKELERLKKTLANDPLAKKSSVEVKDLLPEIDEVANVTTGSALEGHTSTMEIDQIQKEFNPKTLRDKNGAFPIWVHPRKIKGSKKKKKNKGNRKGIRRGNKV